MEKMEQIVKILTEKNQTISTMESCTGGGVANAITNTPDASVILKFSAVTYSNEFKEKMGVSHEIIEKYSVYSKEVSIEMAKNISKFTNSTYGVGITGKLKRIDEDNPYGEDDLVHFTIYDSVNDKCYSDSLVVTKEERSDNKDMVINKIIDNLLEII